MMSPSQPPPPGSRREPGFDSSADLDLGIVDVEAHLLNEDQEVARAATATEADPVPDVQAPRGAAFVEPDSPPEPVPGHKEAAPSPATQSIGEGVFGIRQLSLSTRDASGVVRTLIDDISFDLRRGELMALVGESGAGKSLVGAALMGLLPAGVWPSSGKLWFGGQRLDTLRPAARARLRGRRIAAIFQDANAALDPLFTVGDQLTETLAHHHKLGRAAARERAIVLLGEVGLAPAEARLAQYPHELSGGQRQRVVIALALAGDPEVLIADEPTSALDATLQAQIIDLLQRLARERGLGVLLITHDLGLVAEVCQRVLVLYAGRMVEEGPVPEVLGRPLHPYTAALLGTLPRLAVQARLPRPIPGAMPSAAERPTGCAFAARCPRVGTECAQRPETLIRGTRQRVAVRALGFDRPGEPSSNRLVAPSALPTQWGGQLACWHPLDGPPPAGSPEAASAAAATAARRRPQRLGGAVDLP